MAIPQRSVPIFELTAKGEHTYPAKQNTRKSRPNPSYLIWHSARSELRIATKLAVKPFPRCDCFFSSQLRINDAAAYCRETLMRPVSREERGGRPPTSTGAPLTPKGERASP